MDAKTALERLGGVGTTAQVVELSSRRALRTALERGEVRRATRGSLTLADSRRDLVLAQQHRAVVSHLSAAQYHRWPVKRMATRLWLTVPRNRKVAVETQAVMHVVWADLGATDVHAGVTTPLRTVVDCARRLPFDEALAVADSALRLAAVSASDLRGAGATLRGPGTAQARRVIAAATPLAANPFESVLRSIMLDIGGFTLEPQGAVLARGVTFHPDLVDRLRRVVIEADSHEFHTGRRQHSRDCVRYTALTVAGWRVLRFTWGQVMGSPGYVRSVLADLDRQLGA